MKPTGVAIIGTGSIAEAHIFAYQKEVERARIVALVDTDGRRARGAGGRYGIEDIHSDYREVLARGDVDAVSICTPPFTHVQSDPIFAGQFKLSQASAAPSRSATSPFALA